MAIRMMEDVGAPLVVTAVNIVGRTTFPTYHDWVIYGMTALGYVGGWMGWGGDFVKQMGVASLPLSADKLYEKFKSPVTRMGLRSVSRYPAPASQSPFEGIRLV